MPRPASDKPDRLAESAARLFHQRGYGNVSLRDVAADAEVPPGAVFYHFRTKTALAIAVFERRLTATQALLRDIERAHDLPQARLRALAEELAKASETTALYGCPVGRFCNDVAGAHGERDALRAARLVLGVIEDFVARQLVALDLPHRRARRRARAFVVRWQGASLLALATGDPGVLEQELFRAAKKQLRA